MSKDARSSVANDTRVRKWLYDATYDLCPAAKERVKADIHAHIEDAVCDYMKSGMTRDDAIVRAIQDVGNSAAAARQFRRTYLTRWQDMKLSPTLTEFGAFSFLVKVWLFVAVMGIVLGMFMGYPFQPDGHGLFEDILWLVLALYCIHTTPRLRRMVYQPHRIGRFANTVTVITLVYTWGLFGIACFIFPKWGIESGYLLDFGVACGLLSTGALIFYLRLRWLLRKRERTYRTETVS